jgi:archaellin
VRATYVRRDTIIEESLGMMRDASGRARLETLVLLIVFGIVALVYFYQVVPNDETSSEVPRSLYGVGLSEARSQLVLNGDVLAKASSTSVSSLTFSVSISPYSDPMDLTSPADEDSDGLADGTSRNACIVSYIGQDATRSNLYWTKTPLGKCDDDDLLEQGEQFEITVDLTGVGEAIGAYHRFTLEMAPAVGSPLVITRTTPPKLNLVMTLV